MNKLDLDYQNLLKDILENGIKKETRNGGTISVFGRQIRHKMSEGFPLLTTKKMPFKTIVTELLWFLRGDTNIKFLVDNDCHIWDGDAYKAYLKWVESPENQNNKYNIVKIPISKEDFIKTIKGNDEILKKMGKRYCDEFAKKWGDLGPVYGKQWRSWEHNTGDTWAGMKHNQSIKTKIDQIANSINLLKTDPDSRRNRVNAWNVGELDQMVLPPCHTDFQFFTRELSDEERLSWMKQNRSKTVLPMRDPNIEFSMDEFFRPYGVPKRAISLMWNQRSVDTFLGLPFNIASYGLLLEIIAKAVNMVPDELIGNMGDTHLYSNHIEQAKEQIGRELSLEERNEIHKNLAEHMRYRIDKLDLLKKIDYSGDLITHEILDELDVPKRKRQPYSLPTLKIENEVKWAEGDCLPTYSVNDFTIENYQSHPAIKAPLSN